MNTAKPEHDRWVNPVIFGGVGVVAVYCVAVSAHWLVKLAGYCSMQDWLAWSVPVALDIAGAIAAIVWVKGTTAEARAWGMGIAVGTLVGSLLGNTLAHLIEAGIITVTPGLIIGVASIPPIMLFLSIHLLITFSNRPKAVSRRAKPAEPKPAADATSSQPRAARTTTPPQREATAAPTSTSPAEVGAAPKPQPLRVVPRADGLSVRRRAYRWFAAEVTVNGGDPNSVSGPDIVEQFPDAPYLKTKISEFRNKYRSENPTAVNQ